MISYDDFLMALGATDDEEVKAENRKLCERYPFLKYHSQWNSDELKGYDYDFTYLDDIPKGWKKAFGIQMCEELRDILLEADYLDKYMIVQAKEKWGFLHWYDNGVPEKIYDKYEAWLDKYEKLSSKTCIRCGKPGHMISGGWICPLCKDCFPEHFGENANYEDHWCKYTLRRYDVQ